MNLHGIVTPVISAVNPLTKINVLVSKGYLTAASGKRTPIYATPGIYEGSISGTTLTVDSVTQGVILPGQTLYNDAATILPATTITGFGTGIGGVGTYTVAPSQNVAEGVVKTVGWAWGQVQSLSSRDLRQLESLNIQGSLKAVYFYGSIDAIVRPTSKGGDLLILPDGSTWLTTVKLEDWPDWCKVAVTLQDGISGSSP